jgi:hypothetical protein
MYSGDVTHRFSEATDILLGLFDPRENEDSARFDGARDEKSGMLEAARMDGDRVGTPLAAPSRSTELSLNMMMQARQEDGRTQPQSRRQGSCGIYMIPDATQD